MSRQASHVEARAAATATGLASGLDQWVRLSKVDAMARVRVSATVRVREGYHRRRWARYQRLLAQR